MSAEQHVRHSPTSLQGETERLTLTLESMSRLGEAVAHHEGRVVFVLGGIPGETVEVELFRRKRGPSLGQVVEVLEPASHRVSPPCPYVGPCTGCQWQHIAYEHQLELKRQRVQAELELVGLEEAPVSATLPAPDVFNYRNHARFTVKGESLGFVHRVTRKWVQIDDCMLMRPRINELLHHLQGKSGETTQLSVRYGENTGSWLVQPTMLRQDIPLDTGQSSYDEAVLGRRFQVAASSFFQVNTRQTQQVMNVVLERLNPRGREVVVDAYAGVGTIAILITPYMERVIAVEESASAMNDARINAHGIANLEFIEARTEDALADLWEPPDAVVLDPPRAGCHPRALAALKHLGPARVVYISCDPEALARDLQSLCDGPYRVEEVQPVDMFPQTHHIESVTTLVRVH